MDKKEKMKRAVTFTKRKKGLFKKAQELSILCDADVAIIILSATGKLFEYSNSSMEEILERHSLHSKNMEGPSYSEWQPVEGEHTMLSKEVAEKIGPLRKMVGEALQGMNKEELEPLEKSLEAGLSRLQIKKDEMIAMEIESLEEKGRQLMEENNILRHQKMVMDVSRSGKPIPADLENIIREDGPSSESVTYTSRLPREYESADTSLKLGLNYGGFTG